MALVYRLTWVRNPTLVFGATCQATSIVHTDVYRWNLPHQNALKATRYVPALRGT